MGVENKQGCASWTGSRRRGEEHGAASPSQPTSLQLQRILFIRLTFTHCIPMFPQAVPCFRSLHSFRRFLVCSLCLKKEEKKKKKNITVVMLCVPVWRLFCLQSACRTSPKHPSIYPSIHLSIYLFICPSILHVPMLDSFFPPPSQCDSSDRSLSEDSKGKHHFFFSDISEVSSEHLLADATRTDKRFGIKR